MSGMKMNFHKSEVILMGGEEGEHARVANIINCQEGAFPFKYLGFTIADRKLTITDLEPVVAKVGFYTEPWQGKFMSSTARLTLVDACTQWCCSSYQKAFMLVWTSIKAVSFGKKKATSINTTWLAGQIFANQGTRLALVFPVLDGSTQS